LNFIRAKLPGIPVPEIFRYGFANEVYDFHWILMEFIEGEQLEEIWVSLLPDEQKSLLKDIAQVYHNLHSLQCDQIGGWALANDQKDPFISHYFFGGYLFSNEIDYHLGKFQYVFSLVQKKYPDLPLSFELNAFYSHLRQILSTLDPVPIVMFHGDLAFRNIMVQKDANESGRYRLKAVIDWEWVGTRPIYEDYLTDLHEESDIDGNKQIRDILREFGINPREEISHYQWRLSLCSLEDHVLSVYNDADPTDAIKRCYSVLAQLGNFG
jgi:aminoglycoside phosphotransferase (APT) family kinase protein